LLLKAFFAAGFRLATRFLGLVAFRIAFAGAFTRPARDAVFFAGGFPGEGFALLLAPSLGMSRASTTKRAAKSRVIGLQFR